MHTIYNIYNIFFTKYHHYFLADLYNTSYTTWSFLHNRCSKFDVAIILYDIVDSRSVINYISISIHDAPGLKNYQAPGYIDVHYYHQIHLFLFYLFITYIVSKQGT